MNLLMVVAVIAALAYAGRVEFEDDVLSHMSDATYDVLREELGDVSTEELVDVYLQDTEYWDAKGMLK